MFGLIVGAVPKLLMPARDPGGMTATIILGIVGALIGGFIGRTLGWYEDPIGSSMAVVGALVVLYIYRKIAPHLRSQQKRLFMTSHRQRKSARIHLQAGL